MKAVFGKYSTLIIALLPLSLFAIGWLLPAAGLVLGMIFLVFSLVVASYSVFEKHRKAYLQGKISRNIFIRNIILEVIGILLAMLLAASIGNYIAQMATSQIDNVLTKLVVGIFVGLLVGLSVGFLIKRTWDSIQNRLKVNVTQ